MIINERFDMDLKCNRDHSIPISTEEQEHNQFGRFALYLKVKSEASDQLITSFDLELQCKECLSLKD